VSGNFQKEDLRVQKTCKALTTAMFSLLEHRNFKKITVNDLCNEALVSRAAFYTHFNDKYELLSHCLTFVRADMTARFMAAKTDQTYEELDAYIAAHARMITNLVADADAELLDILHRSSAPLEDASARWSGEPSAMMLAAFWSGGLINIFFWLARLNFPKDKRKISAMLHSLHQCVMDWYDLAHTGQTRKATK
jgi:AcrR family transcriptional regulator